MDTIDSLTPIYMKSIAIDWNLNDFYNRLVLGDLSCTVVSFRISPILRKSIREHESMTIESSLYSFHEWINNNNNDLDISNPFSNINKKNISIYGDYLRFKETFINNIPKFGKWNTLFNKDIPNFNEENATLWIGSKGSHTPLHYDSYGKNVIIQVKGTKKWKLWCPGDKLQPLRLPFEESSIYSSYDPKSQDSIPPDYEFVLEEGDVLFVPKHYWHYVETESDVAVSVNVWLSEDNDNYDQLTEALSLFVFGALKQAVDDTGIDTNDLMNGWISPSELGGTLCQVNDNSNDDDDNNNNTNDDDNNNDDDNDKANVSHSSNYELVLSSLSKVLGREIKENEDEEIMKKVISRLVHPCTIKKCLEDIGIV